MDKPLRYCKQPNCSNLVKGGYCDKHNIKVASKHTSMYNTRWRKARVIFLKAHPLCAICNDIATDVDHIISHKGNEKLFWDVTNWQALCHSCHSTKTNKEDGGFGNKISSPHPNKY